jgi:hypothetical protein
MAVIVALNLTLVLEKAKQSLVDDRNWLKRYLGFPCGTAVIEASPSIKQIATPTF